MLYKKAVVYLTLQNAGLIWIKVKVNPSAYLSTTPWGCIGEVEV